MLGLASQQRPQMPIPWDLEQAVRLVRALYGEVQAELTKRSLDSLADRQFYAEYHYCEHKRLLREKLDSKLGELNVAQILLPMHQAGIDAIVTLEKKVAAQVSACLQSLHAVGDTLAYATAMAAGLNLPPLSLAERGISLKSVADRLPGKFELVAAELNALRTNSEYVYLSALVNHGKHRSVIEPRIYVDATGAEARPYDLRIRAFTYDGIEYESREVQSIELLAALLWASVVKCGNMLNQALSV